MFWPGTRRSSTDCHRCESGVVPFHDAFCVEEELENRAEERAIPNEDLPVALLRRPLIGLGCAPFGGRVPADASLRVLEAAMESGVRYFDVARSYGYGTAESVVARFLRTVDPGSVTIATKVGIQPTRMPQSGLLRRAAQAAAASSPAIRAQLRRFASRSVEPSHFTPSEMTDSFQTSLKELGVERVDVLHLHEIRAVDMTDDVLGWVTARVESGEVGAWGIATTVEDAVEIASTTSVPLVQVPSPVTATLPGLLQERTGATIRHSVVRESIEPVRRLLTDPEVRRRWQHELDLPLAPDGAAALLLRLALSLEPTGPVLAGTTRPQHARELGTAAPLEPEQIALARAMVSDAQQRGAS